MKTGKSLVEMAQELERRKGAKHDLLARADAITMRVEGSKESGIEGGLRLEVGDSQYGINGVAHDQIGAYTGIPAKYYDQMVQSAPELLALNVNHWLHATPSGGKPREKRMVRTLDWQVRAFLSDKYRRIEHEDLAEAILPYLLDQESQLSIMSCEVTDKRFYLKVVHQKVVRELAKSGNRLGDGQHKIVGIVAPAITISNSEVGHGAVCIQVGVYDRFCSNLATFGERSMRKYHAGTRQDLLGDDLSAVLSSETNRLNDRALMATVRDVVASAFDETRFNLLVDTIQGTTGQEIAADADLVKVIEVSSRKLGITEGEQKGVLQALIKGGELSRFGVYNAITAYSQTVDSYDRASELERAGAGVIEMGQSDWDQIALAK